MTEELEGIVADGVGTITLNRPASRNAINQAMWERFPDVISKLASDPGVRVIAIRGAGGNFSGGADIAEFDTVYGSREAACSYAALMASAMTAICAVKKPVIAAIEGFCIGGGVAITLCCDLSFADAAAQFAITPARLGLAYSFADTRRLAVRVGAAAAKDLLFSGRRVAAPEAFRMGLVDRICPAGGVAADVAAYARELAGNSLASINVAKQFIACAVAGQVTEDAASLAAYLDILEQPDFVEGRRAFAARQTPNFN